MHPQPQQQQHPGRGDSSTAAAGAQLATVPLQTPPMDPRRAALAPQHAKHALLDPRKQQGSALHQAGLAPFSTTVVADLRQHDSAAAAPATEELANSVDKHEDDGVEELLYSSAPGQGRAASQTTQTQQQSVRRRGPGESESGVAPEGRTGQLLYGEPLLLEGEGAQARSVYSAERRIADDASPEPEFIPGLGDSDARAVDRHQRSHESVLTASSALAGLKPGIPAVAASSMPARDRQIEATLSSEHASMSVHAGAVGSQANRGGAEGSTQSARLSQPVTLRPPGRLQSLQEGSPRPITLPPPGRPKPITLKPPPAARQGGGNFKAHTMEYRR